MRSVSTVIVVLAFLTAGCAEQNTPELPLAPTPVPASVTDTFTGTLNVQNSGSHNFVVAVASRLAITLTSLGSASDISVGVGIGVPSGLTCALTLGEGSTLTVQPGSTPHLTGIVVPGTFCVVVYDVGNLTDPLDYTLTVAHS